MEAPLGCPCALAHHGARRQRAYLPPAMDAGSLRRYPAGYNRRLATVALDGPPAALSHAAFYIFGPTIAMTNPNPSTSVRWWSSLCPLGLRLLGLHYQWYSLIARGHDARRWPVL